MSKITNIVSLQKKTCLPIFYKATALPSLMLWFPLFTEASRCLTAQTRGVEPPIGQCLAELRPYPEADSIPLEYPSIQVPPTNTCRKWSPVKGRWGHRQGESHSLGSPHLGQFYVIPHLSDYDSQPQFFRSKLFSFVSSSRVPLPWLAPILCV